jgi:hypothetical protein
MSTVPPPPPPKKERRGKKAGFRQPYPLRPPQTPDEAGQAKLAFEAQKQLALLLQERKLSGAVAGLRLGDRGLYVVLAFLPKQLLNAALPADVGGFPVERRELPCSPT